MKDAPGKKKREKEKAPPQRQTAKRRAQLKSAMDTYLAKPGMKADKIKAQRERR